MGEEGKGNGGLEAMERERIRGMGEMGEGQDVQRNVCHHGEGCFGVWWERERERGHK